MVNPITAWHDEHVQFAKLLDLLETQVDIFHQAQDPNYELMTAIVHYLRAYSDCIHHPREDEAFKRIGQYDPRYTLVINRLLQEHRVIANAGESLFKYLTEAAEDVMIPRAELEAAAATYLVYYRNHLTTEERDILPAAARLLTAADWAQVALCAISPTTAAPAYAAREQFAELLARIEREADVSLA